MPNTALAKHDIVRPGGSLTLTSGGAAFHPGKGAAIGGALNAGLLTFTKGLAAELADKRVRVNTVVPGLVKTDLFLKLGHSKGKQEELWANGAKKLSVGFVGTPEDVAEAYLYTARADYTNGSIVVIGECIIFCMVRTLLTVHARNRWGWKPLRSNKTGRRGQR